MNGASDALGIAVFQIIGTHADVRPHVQAQYRVVAYRTHHTSYVYHRSRGEPSRLFNRDPRQVRRRMACAHS
jgi:hypothetical protein